MVFCRTSKMSHARRRRDSCLLRSFHFDSTRHDGGGRWLWRLVRRFGLVSQLDRSTASDERIAGLIPTCPPAFSAILRSVQPSLTTSAPPAPNRRQPSFSCLEERGFSGRESESKNIPHTNLLSWFCRTSKMSHAHGRRGSCGLRFRIPLLHSVLLSLAGAVTDVGVGSGALFGFFFITNQSRVLSECD